jgi:hypothetical protein
MAEDSGKGSSVNVVAIIAIIVLVAIAVWFFMGRQPAATPPAPEAAAPSGDNADVKVEVNLPDTVTINP